MFALYVERGKTEMAAWCLAERSRRGMMQPVRMLNVIIHYFSWMERKIRDIIYTDIMKLDTAKLTLGGQSMME